MKKKKKDFYFIIIFLAIVSISFIYLFQTSYAKYRKQATGQVQTRIASWNIKINNETIKNNSKLENNIIPTFDENYYVKEGVLAPGSTGYFDLLIDTKEVDVDFNYIISDISSTKENPLTDLKITKYELNDSGTKINYDYATGITGDLEKNTANTKIRLYFVWNDESGSQTMTNKDDTTYAQENTETSIKLRINFIQKKAAAS